MALLRHNRLSRHNRSRMPEWKTLIKILDKRGPLRFPESPALKRLTAGRRLR